MFVAPLGRHADVRRVRLAVVDGLSGLGTVASGRQGGRLHDRKDSCTHTRATRHEDTRARTYLVQLSPVPISTLQDRHTAYGRLQTSRAGRTRHVGAARRDRTKSHFNVRHISLYNFRSSSEPLRCAAVGRLPFYATPVEPTASCNRACIL